MLPATSSHYDPAMAVATASEIQATPGESARSNGSDGAFGPHARAEAVHGVLDLDQQLAYEEYLVDRDAWWSEFLQREEAELDAFVDEALASVGSPTGQGAIDSPDPELPSADQDAAEKNKPTVTTPESKPSQTLNETIQNPSGALPF